MIFFVVAAVAFFFFFSTPALFLIFWSANKTIYLSFTSQNRQSHPSPQKKQHWLKWRGGFSPSSINVLCHLNDARCFRKNNLEAGALNFENILRCSRLNTFKTLFLFQRFSSVPKAGCTLWCFQPIFDPIWAAQLIKPNYRCVRHHFPRSIWRSEGWLSAPYRLSDGWIHFRQLRQIPQRQRLFSRCACAKVTNRMSENAMATQCWTESNQGRQPEQQGTCTLPCICYQVNNGKSS